VHLSTSEQLRIQFAHVVARPGSRAMIVTPENGCGGFVSIREAVRRGVSFCVEVRDDLLALDLDDIAMTRALERLAAELREAGHVPVLGASGRPGHRHLFVRVRDRERWITRAKELGFKGDAIPSP
jgi:hypothetical protein